MVRLNPPFMPVYALLSAVCVLLLATPPLRAQRLQVGAFSRPENLQRRVRLLENMDVEVRLQSNAQGVTRVRTSSLNPGQKRRLVRQLKSRNIPYIVLRPEPPPIRSVDFEDSSPTGADTPIERILPEPPDGVAVRLNDTIQRRLDRALGTPYRWGGESLRTGFDCSGFLVWLFPGTDIPRTVARMWEWARPIDRHRLRPGDFVFFNFETSHRPDHVGMYLGGGNFVHASTSYGVIRAVLGKSYYRHNLYGYGRPPSFSSRETTIQTK